MMLERGHSARANKIDTAAVPMIVTLLREVSKACQDHG